MMAPARPLVLEIEPLATRPDTRVVLPGSKSITNRAALCAALADGDTRIDGALFADDTEAMFGALEALGVGITVDPESSSVTIQGRGGLPELRGGTAGDYVRIDARMSGTTGRFLGSVAAAGSYPVMIDGQAQLRSRPFGDLVEVLRRLGAEVVAPAGGESLPLLITGPMRRSEATVATDRSSQFLSGLMLAGPLTGSGLTLHLTGRAVSRPYVEMTAAVMSSFGAVVEVTPDRIRVDAGGYRSPGHFRVEPDATAASYFLAAAAMTGGTVEIAGLGSSSSQGDVGFASVLERMGCTVDIGEQAMTVTGSTLTGIEVDLSDLSDTAPTLAVVAATADGPTTASGIGFIRGKESDRVGAVVAELRRCGVDAIECPDGYTVSPRRPPSGALIRTYDDHRIAMAFSVLGLAVGGMRIENPTCVAKTFPGFYQALDQLRAGSRCG